MAERDPLLVVILGPTASGKTSLSLEIAANFHGEIVNCDSVAMYREFTIGTAKPGPEERSRAPHHLFDVIDPNEYNTAGEYARTARGVIREIASHGALPIVVGGTGLYLRALIEGLFHGPQRSEELRSKLRSRAEEKGPKHLHRILGKLDPAAAANIHENDMPKVIRAVEVCLMSRQPMTEAWKRGKDPLRGFRIQRIGLHPDRGELYRRINARVKKMFGAGLVDETKALLSKYGETPAAMRSIGYKDVVQYLRGNASLADTIRAVQQAHRNYAKRQMTWFRREPDVHWISGFGDSQEVIEQALASVQEKL